MPQFSTHTTRHLCLTDLARMGWELHAIATFAGHRSTETTLTYIHLSGRELADKLARGMDQIHAWRVEMLARLGDAATTPLTARTFGGRPGRAAASAWAWPLDTSRFRRRDSAVPGRDPMRCRHSVSTCCGSPGPRPGLPQWRVIGG